MAADSLLRRISSRWSGVLLWLAVAALAWGLAGCGSAGVQASTSDTNAQQRARLRMELAMGYFQNGQTSVALEEVQQALAADSRYGPAYNLHGLILLQQGDRAGAEQSFRRAVDLNRHDADARHNLGLLLCEQGEQTESAQQFAQALTEPAYANRFRTHLAAGTCALKAGHVAQAASHARAANEQQPSAASLWLGMRAEHQLGHAQAVSAYARRLQQQFPDSAEMQRYQRKAWND